MKMAIMPVLSALALLPWLLALGWSGHVARRRPQQRGHELAWRWALLPTLLLHATFYIATAIYGKGWGYAGIYIASGMVVTMAAAGPIFGLLFTTALRLYLKRHPQPLDPLSSSAAEPVRRFLQRLAWAVAAGFLGAELALLLLVDDAFKVVVVSAALLGLLLLVALVYRFDPSPNRLR